ncbi:unnamed protein product [marine sediment metagenome]|uniref:Uncharacterized protein n=1 Tax=marine sediment metagenome TaxID=412755 RepID=X0SN29_9ZZZZ
MLQKKKKVEYKSKYRSIKVSPETIERMLDYKNKTGVAMQFQAETAISHYLNKVAEGKDN